MPSGPSTTASPSMTNEVVRSRSAASTMHQITRNSSDERTYTTKHGTVATMDTSNIGKPAVAPFDPVQFRGLGRPSTSDAKTRSSAALLILSRVEVHQPRLRRTQ
jgi:hypothetical protein